MNSISFETNQQLYDKIIDTLTFLFFYFLLGFYSTSEMYSGVLLSFEEKSSDKKDRSYAKKLQTTKERWNRVMRMPKILGYYKKNKDIKSLLQSNIEEFNKYFKKPASLLLLEKEL